MLGEYLAHPLVLLAVGEHRRQDRRAARGARPATRARSGRDCPRRGRAARSGAVRRARSAGTARSRSSRPRRSRAPSRQTGRRRRGRAPSEPARDRARPRREPRAPGARSRSRSSAPATARTRSARCAPGSSACDIPAPPARAWCPGAEGIAMITSSGSDSSRMRGRSCLGVPANPHAVDPQTVLAGVVVDEPDRLQPELAVAPDLAQHQPPAVARAHDQNVALAARPRPECAERTPLIQAARDDPHPDQEQQRQQEEQDDDPVGKLDDAGAADRARARLAGSGAWGICTGRTTATPTTVSSTIASTARATAS